MSLLSLHPFIIISGSGEHQGVCYPVFNPSHQPLKAGLHVVGSHTRVLCPCHILQSIHTATLRVKLTLQPLQKDTQRSGLSVYSMYIRFHEVILALHMTL